MNLQLCLHLYIISFPGERERDETRSTPYHVFKINLSWGIAKWKSSVQFNAWLLVCTLFFQKPDECVCVLVCVWMTAKLVIKRTRICFSSVWNWHRGLVIKSFIVSLWWAALCEGKAFSLIQNSHLQSHSAIFNVWPQKHMLRPLQVCVHTLFITVEGIPIPESLIHLEKTAQHSTNSSSTRAILGGRRHCRSRAILTKRRNHMLLLLYSGNGCGFMSSTKYSRILVCGIATALSCTGISNFVSLLAIEFIFFLQQIPGSSSISAYWGGILLLWSTEELW